MVTKSMFVNICVVERAHNGTTKKRRQNVIVNIHATLDADRPFSLGPYIPESVLVNIRLLARVQKSYFQERKLDVHFSNGFFTFP